MKTHPFPLHTPRRQRGVVILFGLIALVIMLIGAVAMVRSMNSSLANAGNLGFKRDLTNQGERAMQAVFTLMESGALVTEAARQTTNPLLNYRARQFVGAEVTPQGLPVALLSDAGFAAVGTAPDIEVADLGVRVRYVIDRLCAADGVPNDTTCTMGESQVPGARSLDELNTAADPSAGGAGAVPQQVVYRLSIRVTGPRDTQAFFQSTFSL